jgi:transposase
VFYLIVVVDAPEKSEYDPVGALGVDLGIENIAVDSDRRVFESKKVEKVRKRYSGLRKELQKVENYVLRNIRIMLYQRPLSQRLKAQLELLR